MGEGRGEGECFSKAEVVFARILRLSLRPAREILGLLKVSQP